MVTNLSIHPLISDHAVLPRDVPVPVSGRAMPGQAVKISCAGQQVTARTAANGRWEATLPAMPAGGPLTLSVSSAGSQLIRRNLLIGDIWLASGQSNMEWPLNQSDGGDAAAATARLPRLRLFTVPRRSALDPQADCEGRWEECSPKTAGTFSAVAFHFGRTLLDAVDVPIGLINASWGGTAALPWTSEGFIKGVPDLAALAQPLGRVRRLVATPPPVIHPDTGNTGETQGWAGPELADAGLPTLMLPSMWQQHGMAFNGAVWFRRWIEIPAAWAGRNLRLDLGSIDDFDTTYFGGTRVAGIGPENPNAWQTPRRYLVPGNLVRAGRVVIAVRVFDQAGDGGFGGPAGAMRIHPEGKADEAISLAGPWRIVVERRIPLPPAPAQGEGSMLESEYPSGLFNGMIAPLTALPIRGVIWYQGESDVERAHLYRTIFERLISSWRAAWGRVDLPFLFVQLANYLQRRAEPADDAWAELREAQSLALRLPGTAMAVAADLGDANDIHPRDKRTVGERLALAALSVAYGRTMPHSGPAYAGHTIEAGGVRVRFQHATGGLRIRAGQKLDGFEVAAADRMFRCAEARIDGATVLVSHLEVASPVAVRYAWQANPPLTLENGIGLPAAPFRTDDWPGVTAGRRT